MRRDALTDIDKQKTEGGRDTGRGFQENGNKS